MTKSQSLVAERGNFAAQDIQDRLTSLRYSASFVTAPGGKVIPKVVELEELLRNAVNKVLDVIEFECANILLIDQVGQVDLAIQCGKSTDLARDRLAIEWVVETLLDALPGLPPVFSVLPCPDLVSLCELREVAQLINLDEITQVLDSNACAYHYIVTLQSNRRLVGVMSLFGHNKRPIPEGEAGILAMIGHQIGVAVENARLYEASEQRARECQTAYEQLQRTQQEMVKVERVAAMSQIATTVSHEINNPLTVVLGNVEHLLAATPTHSTEQRERLKWIKAETIRIRDVVCKLEGSIEDRPVPYLGHTMMIDIHGGEKQHELTVHKQAEEELHKLTEEMENRVSQRTAELTEINAKLVRKINERREAEAKLLEHNRELLSLHSAAAATTASLDLQFVLETVSWEMANLLEIGGCVIYEWSGGAGTVSVIAEYDSTDKEGEALVGQVYSLSNYPLRERALTERYAQQMTVSQPDVDPAELARMQEAGIKTLLILPMVFQDRVVGLAEMQDRQVERVFTDHEISLAQFLTTQAASAVENARLYNRAQREIKERIRAEKRIKASLKEKEVLLKEVHHRVKNNLQVISSMLSLQAQSVEDQSTLRVLKESQNRIRSMALIHERLYRSPDLAKVGFGVYVRDLATHLVRSYKSESGRVNLIVDADDISLDIDTAIPCGLIVNELICNSLKYAFPNGSEGEIRVEIHSDRVDLSDHERLTMIVSDDGVGLPKDLDLRNTGSLGLQLVNALTDQLEGSMEFCSNGGTEFKITFAAP